MAETRDRILEAASALVHEFESWDWRPLTFRAVAARAGVGERTVYRHFTTVQALHEAVMEQLRQESGVDYEDLSLDDVSRMGAEVFAAMANFEAPHWNVPEDGELLAEDERRKAALVDAVDAATEGWSREQRTRAAAALDVLWLAPSYQRLVTAWNLDADEAAEVVDWMIGLVTDAIRHDAPPGAPATRRPASD